MALALTPIAEAKLCVGIDAPRTARAGTVFTVRVTTYLPTWEGRRIVDLEPTGESIPRLRLVLLGPGGAYRDVPLRRTSNPAVWSARLRLGLQGVWVLQVSGWERAPRDCAPPARIRVRG